MKIRPSAVAGMFYPDDAHRLKEQVAQMMSYQAPLGRDVKALIVPHAGIQYSGPIAASAYSQLRESADKYKHVVILGPSHKVPLVGMAVPSVDKFKTPLGEVLVSAKIIHKILALPSVQISDEAHKAEHSIEVQLPFLQTLLPEFDIVPIVVGMANPELVANLLNEIWDIPDTLFIFSSDLSHYHDYNLAKLLDKETSKAIIAQKWPISGEQACGSQILNGLMLFSSKKHLLIEELDLRNSGDTSGEKNSVVGYGAYKIL